MQAAEPCRASVEGVPFVGPAGRLLDRALDEAGIDRETCYVTNAIKHFKWVPRGKRRLHKTPAQKEIDACRQWLLGELEILRPSLVVCLGATAAKAVLGADFRGSRQRGKIMSSSMAPRVLATVHPSSVLRAPGETERERTYGLFLADLKAAQRALRRG